MTTAAGSRGFTARSSLHHEEVSAHVLTRKTTYGIRALVGMARAGERALSVAEIAEREGIPPKFLAGILADLRQRGIVRGHRGPVGGYELAVPAETLSIAEVVETLGGPLFPFSCLSREPNEDRCRECPGNDACPAQQALSGACQAAYGVLRGLVLSDVARSLPVEAPANQPALDPRELPGSRAGGGR
ncbi:MAG TPA: Rrf2 family transcriptional regulator [Polyangiaceae bacterium]|nr:Rrf2 family transcriptional regulator [Polyangiaceae bacterium]